jgi:hypothetical protein
LTTAKFKPLIFSMSGFAFSFIANMFILMIVYDFCLLPTCMLSVRRPQNMLEWSERLANWTQRQIQEIQEICPHVSGRSSEQSNQLGHLSIWTPVITAEVKKNNYNSV